MWIKINTSKYWVKSVYHASGTSYDVCLKSNVEDTSYYWVSLIETGHDIIEILDDDGIKTIEKYTYNKNTVSIIFEILRTRLALNKLDR